MPLEVLPDDVALPFVCPWCGDRFERRLLGERVLEAVAPSLEGHWNVAVECSTNRNAVSSQRPGDRVFGVPLIQPGEGTLRRIRHVDEER